MDSTLLARIFILVALVSAALGCGTAPKSQPESQDAPAPGTETRETQGALPAVGDDRPSPGAGKSASDWIRQLEEGREESLRQALQAIAELGPELGPEAKAAVPALVKLLKHKNPLVVVDALVALETMGPDAEPALPAVVEAFAYPDPQVSTRVYSVLKSSGRGSSRTTGALAALLDALELSESAFPIPGLIHKLASQRREVVIKAEVTLELLSPESLTALAALRQDPRQAAALRTFVRMGPEAVPHLVDMVESSQGNSQLVGEALMKIGAAAEAALKETLRSGPGMGRVRALTILSDMEEDPTLILLEALDNSDERVRFMALDHLAETIEADDFLAIRALVGTTTREAEMYRNVAGKVFTEMGVFVLPVLVETLRDDEERVRVGSAWALRSLGTEALEALPSLIEASNDESWRVRLMVASSLYTIAPDDEEVQAALTGLLDDENPKVQNTARSMLEDIEK